MRSRPIRTPIALLAALGLLVAMTAIPVTAQTDTPTCTAEGTSSGAVAEGVTITYDSQFVCADAATPGTWSISVTVANAAESTTSVTIEEATLSHTTPRPGGEGPAATATSDDLPVTADPGADATFEVGGEYELATTDDGEQLANLHLRLAGVTGDEEGFLLGLAVHVLGPGVEPDLDDPGEIDDPNGDGNGDGRPEWVPGPPPWVIELLRAIFSAGFPWGTDEFPPAIGQDGDDEEANGSDAADAAPPAWVPGPPWAPADDESEEEDGDGPPAFVPPAGGPPSTVPAPPAGPGALP